MKITLPWPPAILSPNDRSHWRKKNKAKKPYKEACYYLGITARRIELPPEGPIPVTITFHPPDNRRRDRDNMIASFKAGQDGFAMAIGVDDHRFQPTYKVEEVWPQGAVVIDIDP